MEAVVRDFGDRNPQDDPVIHFYEHFLAAYDKKQKVSRGVFYTPRAVVSYIVRSVDELLRTEFGLEDGLTDTTTWGEMAQRHKELKIPRACEIKRGWEHAFCTRRLIQHHTVSLKEVNYLFPLWLDGEWPDTDARANIAPAVVAALIASTELAYRERPAARRANWDGRGDLRADFGPQDLFDWIYAVLHSESYRARYAECLNGDFARVPTPQSTGLFRALAGHGRELVELHLLESSKRNTFISTYTGPRNPEVGRIGWSDGIVWLDAGKISARVGQRATKLGTIGFKGVPEDVWDFHIGGYQVCHKWLKDRKGRTLSNEEIAHYQKIVVALNETIRVMAEIDEVIEAHGGWPDAFQTASETDAASEENGEGGLTREFQPARGGSDP